MTFHFCLSLGKMLLLTTSPLLCTHTVPLVKQTTWQGNMLVHFMQCCDLKKWQHKDRRRERRCWALAPCIHCPCLLC